MYHWKHIQLDLYGGEILGIAGISGNGQAELLSLLSGEQVSAKGSIVFQGVDISLQVQDCAVIKGWVLYLKSVWDEVLFQI